MLALGDSYTIGEGVRVDERWPVRLAAQLRANGFSVAEPKIVATTGWTTDELARAIDAAPPADNYDVVTLLIGVNNQYRGRSAGEYREQFRDLLGRAVAFARNRADRVLVVSIPDWGVTPYADGRDGGRIGAEIDAFNAINRQEAAGAGAAYLDITEISRRAGTDQTLVAADGLHPSGRMYAAWSDAAFPMIVRMLRGS